MPRRRRYDEQFESEELPWQFELIFWGIAAVASVVAAYILIWRITGPARDLEAIFGVPVPIEPFLNEIRVFILLLSVASGLKARSFCRRWLLRRLEGV